MSAKNTWRELIALDWRDEPAPAIHPDWGHVARMIVAGPGDDAIIIARVSDGLGHIAPLLAAMPQLLRAAAQVADSKRHYDLGRVPPWDMAELQSVLENLL